MAGSGRFMVGLIGSGLATSLSPLLHEREADEQGLRYLYQLIDIDELDVRADQVGDLVAQARRMGFAGLNITHPCKQAVVASLDELSSHAAVLGAVNTVVFAGARSVGHNTDWSGFADGFARGMAGASLRHVVVLGAGGAGTAVAYALLSLGGQRVTVVDIDNSRAQRLVSALAHASDRLAGTGAGSVEAESMKHLGRLLAQADGIVNATAVGMTPHLGTPVPVDLLRPDLWVADVVYRPLETQLLRSARDIGCRTLNGGGMVVFQAAEAFRLFTGTAPDVERMYQHMMSLTNVVAPR